MLDMLAQATSNIGTSVRIYEITQSCVVGSLCDRGPKNNTPWKCWGQKSANVEKLFVDTLK